MCHGKEDTIIRVFEQLEKEGVNFVTLRGFHIIPNNVSIQRDIDLLIQPQTIDIASKIFADFGFTCFNGAQPNEQFLYETHPNLWFDHLKLDIRFDVVRELAYKSLNNNEMVPVDKKLQRTIFEDKRRVDKIWKYMPSFEDEFVMLVCRCIFDKRTVPDLYKNRIEDIYQKLDPVKKSEYCGLVFQRYTPLLLSTVQKGESEVIFEKYVTFKDY